MEFLTFFTHLPLAQQLSLFHHFLPCNRRSIQRSLGVFDYLRRLHGLFIRHKSRQKRRDLLLYLDIHSFFRLQLGQVAFFLLEFLHQPLLLFRREHTRSQLLLQIEQIHRVHATSPPRRRAISPGTAYWRERRGRSDGTQIFAGLLVDVLHRQTDFGAFDLSDFDFDALIHLQDVAWMTDSLVSNAADVAETVLAGIDVQKLNKRAVIHNRTNLAVVNLSHHHFSSWFRAPRMIVVGM